MTETLFSQHWYRVKDLKPQLNPHVEVHRHEYRNLTWFVLEDKASGRSHRFNTTAYKVIGLMDGNLSVKQIWDWVNDRLGDQAPTQDQIIQLLGKLHNADLLHSGLPGNLDELFDRGQKHQRNQLKQRFGSPLAIKIPLWDPDDFLQHHLAKVSWLFHRTVGLIWFLVIALAALLAAVYWQEIQAYSDGNLLSPYNLAIMLVLYPLLKLLHELGHAFSAKFLGGQVHELGVSFLMFLPIPYVDVSSVNILRSKHQRIIVSAAGIMVELFIAALGLFIWLGAEPGLVRDIAFNMMLIGGLSSLFFNGNPLLKYDGYYILADALEIPNLFQRSGQYLIYLCQKYLFAIPELNSPVTAPGEAKWFVVYSISSFVYRMGLLWTIIVYVTDRFFVVGVLLAVWMVMQQIIWPILKAVAFVSQNPAIQHNRTRAVGSLSMGLAVILLLLFWLPMPSYTCSEGVVWMPEEAQLRSETNGFASDLLVQLPANVAKGTEVIEINDPLLATEVTVLTAKLEELNTQFRAEWDNNHIKADNIMEEMRIVAEQIKQAQKDLQAMHIISKKAGKLVIPEAEDLPGRFVHQGETIGYVLDDALPTARVVVSQADIGRIQKSVEKVELRLVNQPGQIIPASIVRRIPEASNYLPSLALASSYGGNIALDPSTKDKPKTKQKIFQIDLEFSPIDDKTFIGQRVYVRFDHGTEPLAQQWARSFRQVFLRH